MTRSRFALAILAAFALLGCRHTEPALLQTTEPDAPTLEYAISIPEGYDVRSVGFGAAYATSVSGGSI